ncbi:HD-GYP domain-containing protein [Selenomonas ruminantium]|uniref:HD-GYP domain-containing protein n=1 Tax=Selenomonas ruminantium TaxID=971 RepID=UPI000942888B|nr:HD domain-containing phosphohydrolase [Selenomonas ruminantium]
MLKVYAVEGLRAGMVVGRDIVDEQGNALISTGTTLTKEMIYGLLDRPIFSVYVEEEDPVVGVPSKENLLDDDYLNCYEWVYQQLEVIFDGLVQRGEFSANALQRIMDEKNFNELCDGAKAVSQIHNMGQEGSYLVHHCLHVGILAGLMGRWLGWSVLDQYNLVIAGLFLDIGKMQVPKEVLEKQGKLTDEEFEQVKRHSQYGHDLLAGTTLNANQDIMQGILQHHERCDGSGYPLHLKKETISRFGRILAILDMYDAMASDRVFAKRRSPFDVFATLYDDILDGKLDTEYGVLFIKHLCHALNGNWVRLSNGEKGQIVYLDESRVRSLPVVQTEKGEFIDLNKNRDIKVECILTANEV